MWQALIDHFRRYPAQERVVRLMIQNGLRIHGDAICAGPIEIADTAIGRAADVDHRIVRSTVETISQNPQLRQVFTRFAPTLHLKDVAPALGYGVLQVSVLDPHQAGILSEVAQVISQAGLSIRQAIVEDPGFTEEPQLFVITEKPVPGHLIPLLQRVKGVKTVTVRSLESMVTA
ncbi:MAG TPA: amino acid-binding protein [Candidatus Thermoplasmatota archaeon]|nr:amino acid-binding protein [Candidatus Thermoplasmatota archaeon]